VFLWRKSGEKAEKKRRNEEGVGVLQMGIEIGNGVWRRDVPNGWEPAWILGFTNYTQQSIVQLALLINIFLRTRGV